MDIVIAVETQRSFESGRKKHTRGALISLSLLPNFPLSTLNVRSAALMPRQVLL